MDIERTTEFIVENLVDVAARQQRAEVRADRTDRQIRGLQTLMKTGMKMLVKMERRQTKAEKETADLRQMLKEITAELRVEIKEIAAAQKRTDARFDRWLESLKNGSNGHRRKPN